MTWTHYKVTNKSSDNYKVEGTLILTWTHYKVTNKSSDNYKAEGTLY